MKLFGTRPPTRIKKIGRSIFYLPHYHETDRPILAAVSGRESTLIVDAGNSPAHASLFLSKIASRIPSPARHIVLTHCHWDHVFGLSAMEMPALAHRKTVEAITRMAALDWGDRALERRVAEGTEIPFCSERMKKELTGDQRKRLRFRIPETTFDRSMVIDLGGVTCQVDHVGGDHSADSCVVFVPEEKVLFMGDCIFMDIYSGLWRYTTGNLLPLLEKISGYDARIYVLSHSAPLKAKAMKEYIKTLKQVALAVKEHGDNRERIIRGLGGRPTSFQRELIDRFINGIRISARNVV